MSSLIGFLEASPHPSPPDVEWQDQFAAGNRQTSRYAYPVSIALPTTVNVQTDIKILEESGIKNFNLTGISYETEGTDRFLVVDFSMFSRLVASAAPPRHLLTRPPQLAQQPDA